jgi:mono/diheme cytochrome c family protein
MIEKYVDTEELRRLLSGLAIVLGCLIIAGLFASIVVPGLRNANNPETPTSVTPVIGESGWLNPAEFPPQRGSIIPPVDPKALIEPSPELVARGKQLYESNCGTCHGRLGHGDGPAASTMNPQPRNFTSQDGWKNGHEAPGIFNTLSEGIKGTSMASFNYLPKKDRMALVHYVRSLGKFPDKTGSSQAMEALSKELAAPGEKIPNKIPVSMATAALEKEFMAPPPLEFDREDQSFGEKILRRAVMDPYRAAQSLAESRSWRAGPQELATCILPGVPGNGFSIGTATLNASEWQALHAELLKRVKEK